MSECISPQMQHVGTRDNATKSAPLVICTRSRCDHEYAPCRACRSLVCVHALISERCYPCANAALRRRGTNDAHTDGGTVAHVFGGGALEVEIEFSPAPRRSR